MTDPRVTKLARLLVQYCVNVRPGDRVILMGNHLGLPLIEETLREVLRAGGHPLLEWSEDTLQEVFLKEAGEAQLAYIHPPVLQTVAEYEKMIRISAPGNTRSLSGISPQLLKLRTKAMRPLLETRLKRAAVGEMDWVGTQFPTNALAQEADMSLSEFEDFVFEACFVDRDDPIASWQHLSSIQQKLVDWLRGRKDVRVKGPNADLSLSIEGRSFINSDGHRNMPSGEIFTGPVEDSVNGWVRFTYPSIVSGREVEGIELKFEAGKVIAASARKNEAYLMSVLDTDPGARYLGEFAVGTNSGIDRFTKSILYDEKIGGTIHMAVGLGYPDTGSQNTSAVHWDMICDMRNGGQIWVDGELFYESGVFTILDEQP